MFCKHMEEGRYCGRTDATLCDIYSKGFTPTSEWLCAYHQNEMLREDDGISIYPRGGQMELANDDSRTAQSRG